MAIERKKDKYGNKMRHRGGALLRMTAAIVFWLLVWQLLSFLIGSELLLPSPWAVVRSFCGLAQTTEFYRSILHTLLRVAAGFAAGMAAGLLAGTLSGVFTCCRRASDSTQKHHKGNARNFVHCAHPAVFFVQCDSLCGAFLAVRRFAGLMSVRDCVKRIKK